jgi:putative toxin-antitoxin system antitoxin component (TIGR02293 family)
MSANPILFSEIGVSPKSDFELVKLIKEGFPVETVDVLKRQGLTFTEISDIVIPPRTLKYRKARGEALSREESERVIRVSRTIELADKIFGSHDKAMSWLRNPDERYENTSPLYLLDTDGGARMVEKLLWRIAEGVYA